jgi:hypothetical protein
VVSSVKQQALERCEADGVGVVMTDRQGGGCCTRRQQYFDYNQCLVVDFDARFPGLASMLIIMIDMPINII